jgi:hypothetical protein
MNVNVQAGGADLISIDARVVRAIVSPNDRKKALR